MLGVFVQQNLHAKRLGNEGELRLRADLDTQLAAAHDRAGALAFLLAFLPL